MRFLLLHLYTECAESHRFSLIARIGFEISHGYTVRGRDDPMLLMAEQANRDFAKAMAPGHTCAMFSLYVRATFIVVRES